MKKYFLLNALFLILLCSCQSEPIDNTNKSTSDSSENINNSMHAKIETTKGEILIELEFQKTPITVANFVGLVKGEIKNSAKDLGQPYFNGIKFHRVIKDFMIQGGDPTGTGRGGPGYKFPDEFHPDLKHSKAGILSMANSGPGTNGSQFFITHKETPWLDGKHTVFGYVIAGQHIVDAIEEGDIIINITIINKGEEAQLFNAANIFNEKMEEIKKTEEEKDKIMEEKIKKHSDGSIKTSSGLRYVILKKGEGNIPKKGDHVNVEYTGSLLDGTIFDQGTYEFPLGAGKVIKGWDEGIALLNVGTQAKLIIPPDLGYGTRGAGDVIPPNAILIFEIKLLGTHDANHHH